MRITHEVLELHTTHPFNISRAAAPPVRRNVWVRIVDDDGAEGWGEAAPSAYYSETTETVIAALPLFEAALNDAGVDVLALDMAERAVDSALDRAAGHMPDHPAGPTPDHAPGTHASARAAVSAALHDLAGKRLGVPVWQLWGLDAGAAPPSSFTIGIDTPDVMRRKLDEAASYPILKLKVGTPDDGRILQDVRRAAPDRIIRIDANTTWTLQQALDLLPLLDELDIEFIEQPFGADDLDAFRTLRDRSSIPIVADESCRTSADITRLAGAVDGINIKLEKCGSLREAVRMVHVARALGMKVMIGCMLTTTLGIAAAMQIAPLVDWADLDATALLREDPFNGPRMNAAGALALNSGPGLGVTHRQILPMRPMES